MSDEEFSIEQARRSRISKDTRVKYASGVNQVVKWAGSTGRNHILMPCAEVAGQVTVDLAVFKYQDFLDFIVWTVNNKPTIQAVTLSGYRSAIGSLYRDRKLAIPVEFGDDMKEIMSGI
jgi:hypothetical protein